MPTFEETIYVYECDECGETEDMTIDEPPEGWQYDEYSGDVTCFNCLEDRYMGDGDDDE